MTGAEHYREAERLLVGAEEAATNTGMSPYDRRDRANMLTARAQVHATLAQAAATALAGVIGNNVAPSHPANKVADDDETITAVNDWHEAAARRTS